MIFGNGIADSVSLIAIRLGKELGEENKYYILKNRMSEPEKLVNESEFLEISNRSKTSLIYDIETLSPQAQITIKNLVKGLARNDYNIRIYDGDGELIGSRIQKDISGKELDAMMHLIYMAHFEDSRFSPGKQEVVAEKIIKEKR